MHGYEQHRVAGTFGTIQLGASDQTLVVQIVGRNYDTTGFLHVDAAHVRLPLHDAIRLHALLADAIVAAEHQTDSRQAALWSESTINATAGRYGWRAS